MQKDQAYHEAAIVYNEGLAECAEQLVETLGHEEVQRWSKAVAKQHRFHAKRHQSALDKLIDLEEAEELESAEEAGVSNDPTEVIEEDIETVDLTSDEQEEPIAVVEVPIEVGDSTGRLADGCIIHHQPTLPTCEFYPGVTNG